MSLGSSLIFWNLKKQYVIVSCSIEAKHRALAYVTAELCQLKNLVEELHL